jgi:uncharacterized phage protein (TIGR01671 family)
MNDRFRFRAWDKDIKRYWEPGNFDLQRACKDKSLIIEQCTGLKDKNGKLIYEGDIIFSNVEYGGTYFVIIGGVRGYCYDAVAVEEYKEYFARGKDTGGGLSSTAYHIITDHGPCEVVGNIHENPELLEDK